MSENCIWVHSSPNISALAWELSHCYPQGASILCPNVEYAEKLSTELEFFTQSPVFVLRQLDIDSHLQRRPAIGERKERLRFFYNLSQKSKSYFLWTIPALLEKYRPTQFLASPFQKLSLQKNFKREHLIEELLRIGFEEAEIVEIPGQYAARGSIVDLYGFFDEFPVRIDLNEDVIQTLHTFDPQSQIREEALSEITLFPTREFLEEPSTFKSALKRYLYEHNYSPEMRESLLSLISGNCLPLGFELWSFLKLNQDDSFLEDPFRPLVIIEPDSLNVSVRQEHMHLERKLKLAFDMGDAAPGAEHFLRNIDDVYEELKKLIEESNAFTQNAVFQKQKNNSEDTHSLALSATTMQLSATWKAHDMAGFSHSLLESSQKEKVLFVFESLTQKERLEFLLSPYGLIFGDESIGVPQSTGFYWTLGDIEKSFQVPTHSLLVLAERDILATPKAKQKNRNSAKKNIRELFFRDIREGDLVVHQTHGVGQYLGLKALNIQGQRADLIEIQYKDGKVFVPVQQLRMLARFSGGENTDAQLDKLGGSTWKLKKDKAKKEILALAGELLTLYTQRALSRGPQIDPSQEKILSFAASFPFEETPDQEKAISAILEDLHSGQPMDRLLCGDVGYGKTEVSLRAAHAVAASGYQVAVLSPTTLLTAQHERLFKSRLGAFGISVASLSRFCSDSEAKEIIRKLSIGEIQVVVGTHRLLSNDVSFKNLGLVVIDEEQRFGVIHKEKLKKLRSNVHVLSMTATPIPRTLSMSLSGVKQFSVMTTPPQDRLSVKTLVLKKNAEVIREAIDFEIRRGGQVFYLYNRVRGIERVYEELKKYLPNVRFEFAHGQMNAEQLEEKMLRFYRGETQVLVTTTIVEAGLDVPNANTLIVENADNFGLSQLYQLRGRVGRSDRKAYAYLLLPESGAISKDADQRLSVLEAYQDLGSGFTIASHDLDLRGAGEVLGDSQSGHMSLVGSDTYFELLQESLADLKGEVLERDLEPEIQLNLDTTIPESYIKETALRLSFYRRFSSSSNEEAVEQLIKEMDDRFGTVPESVQNLSRVMKILCVLRRIRIRSLNSGKTGITIIFDPSSPVSREKLVERVLKYPQHFQLSPDGKFIIRRVSAAGAKAGVEIDDASLLKQIDSSLSQIELMT